MKARRVRKLDPDAPLADNAERIVRVRLDELCSFVPAALDPKREQTLHDMRIAAKRLRYILELTSPCFGPYAARAGKHARELQDQIGEIHDCDVMIPLILDHIAQLRDADAQAVAQHAQAPDAVDPNAADHVPNRAAYRPLELLVVQQQARRRLCFERFVASWTTLERSGFRKRLEKAISERPEAPVRAPAPAPSDPTADEPGPPEPGSPEPSAPDSTTADAAELAPLAKAAVLKRAVAR